MGEISPETLEIHLFLQVAWQTGLKIPTLRIHGLHTNATYLPLRSDEA